MNILKVADEICPGLAMLHRENPERRSFSAGEIADRLRAEARSAKARMSYKLADGIYELRMVMPLREEDDPVLQMAGVGKEICADVDADEYVRELRSNW